MSQYSNGPITPDDIKSKLGDLQGEARQQVDGAKNAVDRRSRRRPAVGVAFMLGRRGGGPRGDRGATG
jgi:hypothetical protein